MRQVILARWVVLYGWRLGRLRPLPFILLAMRAKPNQPATDVDEDRFGAVKGATLAVGVGLGIWLVIAWVWFG